VYFKSNVLTITILSLINGLFAWKYASRASNDLLLILSVLISTILPFLLYFIYLYKLNAVVQKILNSGKFTLLLLAGVIICSAAFYLYYPQELLRVDRYEMIRLFWDNFLSQKCPYCPRSEGTNIPGPFPFYFFAAFPFYLIGETGLYSILGFLLFAGIILKTKSISTALKNTIFLLLVTSPAVLFELFCRSTNLLNSTLLLFCCILISRINLSTWKQLIAIGIVTGFVMSTRSFSFLIFALAFIYTYKKQIFHWKVFGTSFTALLTFVLTFIPVIIICGDSFRKYNPFSVQAMFAPPFLTVSVAVSSCVIVYFLRSFHNFSTICGYGLFILTLGYSLSLIALEGFREAIFSSSVDISYFCFAIPFILYGLGRVEEKQIILSQAK
jgi:hypothetical protein